MGVIKKNENQRSIVTASSQDSLNAVQSDDELSIASVSSEVSSHIPVSRAPTRNNPRPMSFTNVRGRMGKKRIRRQENALQLETLAEESEIQEVTIDDLVQRRNQGFSRLFKGDNMEEWYAFMERSEEAQNELLCQLTERHTTHHDIEHHNAGKEFLRIKTGLRNVLKRPNLPMGMLCYLENEIVTFFSDSPRDIYVSGVLSSFERLLLHAVSQYHSLCSISRTDELSHTRLVHVWNRCDYYTMPKMLLCEYLDQRGKNVQETKISSSL